MGFEENSSDVLAISHVILIAKMSISKYGKYFELLHLFERELSLRNV